MKLINLLTNNPSINLSSEYYYLTDDKYKNEDIIIIWKNKNTIVIGKNQNLASEVNQIYANEVNTKIVRRFTGGGAVFQDDGNICFTFIKRNQKNVFDFKKSLNDIIEFLNKLNINVHFSGRNDILLGDKKISGNAVYFYKNDYMIHGTLLFDLDVEKMVKILTVDKSKLISKGIESVKSRIANLKDVYSKDVNEFHKEFIHFFENKYNLKVEHVDLSNNPSVIKLNNETFDNYNWIYGRDFEFNFENKIKTLKGLLMVKLLTENNLIKDIEFYSDSLTSLNLKEMQKYFLNQKYDVDSIKNVIKKINLNNILEDISQEELITLFFA